jgi:ribosomal protein S18 acetylase RimI-like enzyme
LTVYEPIIRTATEADLPDCARVYIEAFARAPYYEQWSYRDAFDLLTALREKESETCYCMAYEDVPQGFAFCSVLGRFRAVVEEFAVHPRYQNLGWGRRLMERCLADFKARGFQRAELIAHSGAPAYGFYRRLGFRQSHRYVLMLRDL